MITAVTLNPTIDIVTPVETLKKGAVLRTKAIYAYPGGKGTNVARAAAALGAKTCATGFVGIRDSRETEHFLGHHGVETDFIACRGSNRICLLITETSKNGSETVINSESDIDISGKEIKAFMKNIVSISKKSSCVVFSGSLPLALQPDFYKKAILAVRPYARVILDTSSGYLLHGVKASPHIIKQNIHELEGAFGKKLSNPAVLKAFIRRLSEKNNIPVIITTMNEKGALLYSSGNFIFYPALKVKNNISPVGCGDAFSAGLSYGLSKGFEMDLSCRIGVAAAAANLGHLGSCFIKKKDVFDFLKLVKSRRY
ncbi:MAG: PfkB family carbohydrate kinase [Candidatus Goldiibacteriota bacterium]|jgi:1-phosphofructokinase family hexose kinase